MKKKAANSKAAENGAANVPAVVENEKLRSVFGNIHHPKKRRYLAAVAICGRVTEAARLTGINVRFHYLWKEKDPEYLPAFEKAKDIACDRAEDEVFRRAFDGIEHPLSFKGKLTGDKIREYSDLLAMFFLKGARPEKYREDSRLQINVNVPPAVNFIAPASPAIDVPEESE